MPDTPLIIGYGNPLRSDDALGWKAAELLAETLPPGAAEIVAVQQLTPEFADAIAKVALVIFIDAAATGEPGAWSCEPLEPESAPSALGHFFTPQGLLAYAKAVFHAAPRALLVSATGSSFEFGETLSPLVAAVLPDIVKRIAEEINRKTGME